MSAYQCVCGSQRALQLGSTSHGVTTTDGRDPTPHDRGSHLADSRWWSSMQRRRPSKITNPMTPIGPVPFVGRSQELAALKEHLAVVPLVSLHGALGSGKTRLVSELVARDASAGGLAAPTTVIECYPGDRAAAL